MNRTERIEEAEIEAVLEAERNICNHPIGWTALQHLQDSEGEALPPLPIIERPDAGQLNRSIRRG